MGNVIVRRNKPYISNVDYGGKHIPFVPKEFDCGGNIFRNFIEGDVKRYLYPYPDGTDIYISDAGVYFPAQYCNELTKYYGYFATFMALSRHLGASNVHTNAQSINRLYDKLREQSDVYLCCNWCKVFCGKYVLQVITLYECYDSAVKRVPPFRLAKPLINPDRRFQWEVQKNSYDISHGTIRRHLLFYRNKSSYNTRIFKEVLANGSC